MAAARKVVELFYDVVSPYSWFGFEVLCRYQHVWNIDLRLRPAFLGGIMHATGNKAPGLLPKRGEYMLKDIERMGKYYQVPIKVSAEHLQRLLGKVPPSLGAMRFLTAIDMTQPQFLEPVSREFWIRFWSQHEDINQPASILAELINDEWVGNIPYTLYSQPVVQEALQEVAAQAGLPSEQAQKLLEMVSSPAVKDRLRATTDDAIKYGAFGMPATVVHFNGEQHHFFGSDRIELLGSIIGEKWLGPVPSLPSSKM